MLYDTEAVFAKMSMGRMLQLPKGLLKVKLKPSSRSPFKTNKLWPKNIREKSRQGRRQGTPQSIGNENKK